MFRVARWLSIALAMVFIATWPARVHAQLDRGGESLLGPPIASDFGAIRDRSPELGSYTGGRMVAVAAERARPYAWVVQGSRVVAFDVSGDKPRERGRSPVLPDPLLALAADDGVVLAWSEGFAPGAAWLIDGRDPDWPRDVRPLALDGPVRTAAMDGRTAMIVVADEVVLLDVSDPRRPSIQARAALPEDIQGDGTPLVAFENGWIAVAEGGRAYVGLMSDEGDISWIAQDQPGQVVQIELAGDRLFVLRNWMHLHILRLDTVGAGSVEQVVVFTDEGEVNWNLFSFVATDRLLVIQEAKGYRVMERTDGAVVWVERPQPYVGPLIDRLWRAEEGADELRMVGLGNDLQSFRLPFAPAGAMRLAGSGRPSDGPLYAVASRDNTLIGSGDQELRVLDVTSPTTPRLLATVPTDVDVATFAQREGQVGWLRDRVWLHDTTQKSVFDVADSARPRLLGGVTLQAGASRILGGPGAVSVGPNIVTTDARYMVVLDDSGEDAPELIHRSSVPGQEISIAGVDGNTVWFVAQTFDVALSGLIVAIDVSRPRQPRLVHWPITILPSAATLVAGRWLAIVSNPVRFSAVLTIFDTRADGGPRAVGTLEFESSVADRVRLQAIPHAYGNDVLMTVDDRRLIHVDLSVPAFLDEKRTYWLPESGQWPTVVGDTVWLAGRYGGLMSVRLDGVPFKPSSWLSLPFLSQAGLRAP